VKERYVLSSCIRDRNAWTQIRDHVKREDFSEQGWLIWGSITTWYEADLYSASVNPELLAEAVARRVTADKHKDMFRELVQSIAAEDASPANVVKDLLATKRDAAASRLASALLSSETGQTEELLARFTALCEQEDFSSGEDITENIVQGRCVTELISQSFKEENLIQVRPRSLNDRLEGGLKPGHHVLLFGRPEMGKTMLTIEMISGFLDQGLMTMYIGNEDPIDDINMRVVNRLSGMTKAEVMADPETADTKAREAGYDNLILYPASPGTTSQITKLIENYQPQVLIIDQLRNLDMKQDNYVLKMEQAATQARNWAKKYGMVVISVTQAGDSASGKAVLDIGDVDYSNTGIPAQTDVMVGLGATNNNVARGEIVLSLPKNKVSGRHEYFTLKANPQLSQLESLD